MRDLITGAPGPDLEYRLDDLERTVRDLRSQLRSLTDRIEHLEEEAEADGGAPPT